MKLRVLIVDADNCSGQAIHTAVSASNLDAVLEPSSSRAAEYLRKEKYDALFFDMQSASPDGVQLARMARSSGLNRRTPIIMVANGTSPDVMSRAFEAGANFFLFKPFDRSRLLRVLRVAQAPIEQERRRFHRVQVELPATILFGDEQLSGKTVDLSLQGMLLEVSRLLPTGSGVRVRLELEPNRKPVTLAGKVVRHSGADRLGVELDALSNEDNERMQGFLFPLILKSAGV
jgi:DNA-binding response OmpR family regulator